MLHTIQEAIALTGKSRRTIYNHCDEGRLSYSVGHDSRRYFETSELIRVYGSLRQIAQPSVREIAQSCTPINLPETLTETTALRLVAALEKLIKLEEQKLLRIEHLPKDGAELVPPNQEALAVTPGKPESFSDLLKTFD